jgi:hypothetical protein
MCVFAQLGFARPLFHQKPEFRFNSRLIIMKGDYQVAMAEVDGAAESGKEY